ncbi:Cell wall-associated hydrolase, NlpC family [Nonomuraea solani]|uniref:Cell wall-associated hydrolase, NlpC family n=1 Tax=Nonomuraea solani TaxID=1144553 RepID=A0A1H6DV39_9ACTN|nr:C40 family peptidase [Nonomuraea solani]SEG89151.1 Cell wall-associated hydrolase, NlpC family [Nonomuraea solani]
MKNLRRLRPAPAAAAAAVAVVATLALGGTAVASLTGNGDETLFGFLMDDDQSLLDGVEMEDEEELTDDWIAGKETSGLAAGTIDYAREQLGKPYGWGEEGPMSFDCSGLMQKAFAAAGVDIPRVTYEQWRAGERVAAGEERPGDLVFMRMQKRGPGHVGLVTGPGQMIHAPAKGDVVREASYGGRTDVVGFVRVTQMDGKVSE